VLKAEPGTMIKLFFRHSSEKSVAEISSGSFGYM